MMAVKAEAGRWILRAILSQGRQEVRRVPVEKLAKGLRVRVLEVMLLHASLFYP